METVTGSVKKTEEELCSRNEIVERPIQSRNEAAWEIYRNRFKNAKFVMAPMVDQSELAFRLLVRKYTPDVLCYTPMFHSYHFSTNEKYRQEHFTTTPEDRPLIAQFCANDPDTLVNATRFLENDVDGIDLNLGCPQGIARRGHYGAFLMEEPQLVYKIVSNLVKNSTVPITCKCRIFDDWEKTKQWVQMLESTGIVCLAVHGRTRDQKPNSKYRADWETIRKVRELLSIPVIANGNIQSLEDIEECIKVTGTVGVMSAETLLENPALFTGKTVHPCIMALEYLAICQKYTTPLRMIRSHVFQMLHPRLSIHFDLREKLQESSTLQENIEVVEQLYKREQDGTPPPPPLPPKKSAAQTTDEVEDVSLEGVNLFG